MIPGITYCPGRVNDRRAFGSLQVRSHRRDFSVANQDGAVFDIAVRDGQDRGVLNEDGAGILRARRSRPATQSQPLRPAQRKGFARFIGPPPPLAVIASSRVPSSSSADFFSPDFSGERFFMDSNQRPSTNTCFTFVFLVENVAIGHHQIRNFSWRDAAQPVAQAQYLRGSPESTRAKPRPARDRRRWLSSDS